MSLDPKLGGADRIGNLVIGAGLVAYALLGSFNQPWTRGLLVALGLVSAAGGVFGH